MQNHQQIHEKDVHFFSSHVAHAWHNHDRLLHFFGGVTATQITVAL
jgi:hypothetical protein